jgi:hypothetical protein
VPRLGEFLTRPKMRRIRRKTCVTCLLVLVGIPSVAVVIMWVRAEPAQHCYANIEVGMSYRDANDLLSANGFSPTDGSFSRGEAVIRYERDWGGPAIVICVRDGIVSYKEYDDRATLLGSITRLLAFAGWTEIRRAGGG